MPGEAALRQFDDRLTATEKREVLSYDMVYYIPKRKRLGNSDRTDNESGDYLLQLNDHIDFRFEVVSLLGKGSFSQVVKAFDHKKKEVVALKVLKSKSQFAKQAQSEIKILNLILEKDLDEGSNVVHMRENFEFRGHT
jgi:dual specificity tyrosine-phosphorylation-regulated kinase 2/3/4